jgi:multiple sugar transport system permease protein
MRDRDTRHLLLMLAPFVLGLAVLIVLPAAVTFVLALTEYDLIRSPSFVGLDNFRELADDEVFRIAVRNSLMFIAFAVPLRLAGGRARALLMHRRHRGVGAYRTSAYLPSVVPDVAYALLWLWIFNPLYGPLNLALEALGGPTPRWQTDPRAAQWAIIIMSLFLIGEGFLVALESAKPLFVFARVTLPLMAPTLLLLLFRDTIFSFQATFVPALIVTEGGPPPYATTYLPVFAYSNAFEYLRYGYAAAATLVMFLVTAIIVYVQYRIVRRWRHAFVV